MHASLSFCIVMELNVSRNLACIPYSWKVPHSLKYLAPCVLDSARFLRRHLDRLAFVGTRERKW